MPDLTDLDRAQAVEAARVAGAKPERAAVFVRGADLSAVPRAADGRLDAAALAAAMTAAAAEAPELTLHGVVPTAAGARRAPELGGAPMGAGPGSSLAGDAEVAATLARMQKLAGIHVPGAQG